jgi:hypothetical protein
MRWRRSSIDVVVQSPDASDTLPAGPALDAVANGGTDLESRALVGGFVRVNLAIA